MKKFLLQLYYAYIHEFSIVRRDMGIMIFIFLLPVAYPVVYSLIYNPELVRDIKTVVVDNDRSSLSRELARNLDATQGVDIIGYAADLPEARRAMDSHEAYAILQIPKGFEKNAGNLETAKAVIYCDMSLLLRYRAILVASTDVMQELGSKITAERIDVVLPLAQTISSGDIMPVENAQMGNITGGFDSFIMPGVLILILQQSLILAIGMAGGAKHENPSLIGYNPLDAQQSVVASMIGQMACYLTLIALPVIFLIHYVPLIFAFPMAGNVWHIFLFVCPMIIASCGLGFALQGLIRERESIFVVWVATSIVFLFLSGLTWPRYAFPGFWKAVADIVPATWGIQGFIRMNANGATIAQVHEAYINLWILAVGWMAAGMAVQKFVLRRSLKKHYAEAMDSQMINYK